MLEASLEEGIHVRGDPTLIEGPNNGHTEMPYYVHSKFGIYNREHSVNHTFTKEWITL